MQVQKHLCIFRSINASSEILMQAQKTFMQVRLKTFMHVQKTFMQVQLKTFMHVQKTFMQVQKTFMQLRLKTFMQVRLETFMHVQKTFMQVRLNVVINLPANHMSFSWCSTWPCTRVVGFSPEALDECMRADCLSIQCCSVFSDQMLEGVSSAFA